ncbi:hypothetical protein [Actinokineospora sp.]|uniref:hypothetical protein n=1 Tax=Actinokineospora sp. TaxID=1872133 RepID=UPI00403778F3
MTEPANEPTTVRERALPCGRTLADLVAVAADGPGADPVLVAHAADCPHCGAELAALRAQWDLVRAAAAEPVHTPDGLVSRVLDSVRGVRGRGGEFQLDQVGGALLVAERVVVLLARSAAADLLAGHGGGHLRSVRAAGDTVDIGLAVRFGTPIQPLAELVRAHVSAWLREHLGTSVPAVTVDVVDVIYPV